MNRDLPVRKSMCQTCPFRPGSPYAFLAGELTASALTESSRVCHSTGGNNAIHKRTGLKPHLCRGARDRQIKMFFALGFIAAPTDAAWNEKRVEMGMKPNVIQDPEKKRCTQR